MRVFVFEYVTGGGLLGSALPSSLAREGDLMLHALVSDLAELNDVQCVITRDARLGTPELPAAVRLIREPEGFHAAWTETLAAVDAVWPIAPEHQGVLEAVSHAVLEAGVLLLNSRPAAVRIAASKRATLRLLEDQGVAAVPTFGLGEPLPPLAGPWVLKPDDGVGCEGIRLFRDQHSLARHWRRLPDAAERIAQPFIQGTAASLSLLVEAGDFALLGTNRQRIAVMDDRLVFLGCTVNGLNGRDPRLRRLAGDVVAALPGLWGYVGVDLIMTPGGPQVLEVNPRLTTSYVGLKESLDCNPAGLVLDLLSGAGPRRLNADGLAVDVSLEFAGVA